MRAAGWSGRSTSACCTGPRRRSTRPSWRRSDPASKERSSRSATIWGRTSWHAGGMSTSTDSPAPARDGEIGVVPDFFIVGHAKCGTTALYEMLRTHPEIFMPELKEPAYFAGDLRRRFQPPGAGPLPETLPEYLALFEPALAGQRVGEASSLYLWSHEAAAGIAALSPEAKIIAILREPASFLRSLHMQLLQNHIESERSLRR